jgi:hypothetical protein
MKNRGGTKTNTIESKERAKKLLKTKGIKTAIKIALQECISPSAQTEAAPPASPPNQNNKHKS